MSNDEEFYRTIRTLYLLMFSTWIISGPYSGWWIILAVIIVGL